MRTYVTTITSRPRYVARLCRRWETDSRAYSLHRIFQVSEQLAIKAEGDILYILPETPLVMCEYQWHGMQRLQSGYGPSRCRGRWIKV